ncbi:oxidoreductase domain protein [Beutenbergia cavernae DSM 12333]|uniref:Oxidoreductase domain protein n=1 Tax=Beutenbergia cavernae (strain ATCC BAA-8 / DSM 12333 / CCUG 43141 / JCM 11478 / NBRC 16432 / NCIMB 13614 / HKI 0122) TaxID=471853 RepID=C5C213_BEUC1|nr:Gfo/Idh/MocA family oxidoreductase [Beutenbergia cavernae]ACQ81638.1 oxidoreductase domain protein [Beutenbergia cavernae DSM 12333]
MSGTGRVGVGLIGAGVISKQYLENLTAFPDLDVRFVADLDVERARTQADAFGVPGAGTVEELLADAEIEIVVNLTIPAVHADVDRQIIAAGKHVWSEKPFALDRSSGQEVLEAAREAGVRVACAPDTFLGAGLQTARRVIASGRIGEPQSALFLFQSPGPESWHPSPEFLFAVGGGPLLDIGPYYLTALVQNLGAVASVTATGSRTREARVIGSGPKAGTEFPVEVPTNVNALLVFESGASAVAVFSFDSHLRRAGAIDVMGTLGTVTLPDPNTFTGPSTVFTSETPDGDVVPHSGSEFGRGSGVLDLARSIRAGVREQAPAELAFHVLDVMDAIGESIASGETVSVLSTVQPSAILPEDWDPSAATL